ncbi:MAG: polysaccharide biosynthesis tyrosine autokinase [Prevotella sp.]|nr:polysaccharide biosynthesis tyrosine autokinase [Prevotella sp.]
MSEIENNQKLQEKKEEESASFNFETIYTAFILNWKWFLLSAVICVCIGFLYVHYKIPEYNVTAKLLIKDNGNQDNGFSQTLEDITSLGIISNSYGTENEMEILTSANIAEEAVRDLKIYVSYYKQENFKKALLYGNNPINVDMDEEHLDKLSKPVKMKITRKTDHYVVKGSYYIKVNELKSSGPYKFEKEVKTIPASITTRVGKIILTNNGDYKMEEGDVIIIEMNSPRLTSYNYVKNLTVDQTTKTSSVLDLGIKDQGITRGMDYLRQLVVCYNRQANIDKNELAKSTEQFINDRLEKIDIELGSTDTELEKYKKQNNLMELQLNATTASANTSAYEQKLTDAETQLSLISSLIQFANRPGNKHQVLPSNVGLKDESSTSLINEYNKAALERNRLLNTASETSPVVSELTSQLDNMQSSIMQALEQAKKNLEIERDAIKKQLSQYNSDVTRVPEQERILTQIGRQQEVRSGLYLMLLQKREENSISLAATADKGKIIENPKFDKKVSPRGMLILLALFIIGLAIPAGFLYIINFLRYKIEGHDDVAALTDLPIIADIVTASETAKTKADIVVHENENNQMEEIFRSMRTNIQFMLKENENVLLFTSSTSGEGKTFTAANLAVSFALLGKKVILIGLDIRKPRLAELFDIRNHHNGISVLLMREYLDWENVKTQIVPSDVNDNLDLLMAGPIPPNPAELVSRPSLGEVIKILKENYDYVLIDTAPVGLVADTLQIAKSADLTVYLCRADFTPKVSFSMINALAEDKKLPNLCIAINGIDLSRKKYGYYYGYGKYGKYSRYGVYGRYGRYGKYSRYANYGNYGNYSTSHYANKNDNSVKH